MFSALYSYDSDKVFKPIIVLCSRHRAFIRLLV